MLAQLELEAFIPGRVRPVPQIAALENDWPSFGGLAALDSFARPAGTQAFLGSGPLALLPELICRLSFVQRICALTDDSPGIRAWLDQHTEQFGPLVGYRPAAGKLAIHALPHCALFELTDVAARRPAGTVTEGLDAMLAALMGRTGDRRSRSLAESALKAQITTGHLAHDLHYYKAKFFPRLARSAINLCARQLGPGPHRLLDPFVGSGTALVEAAALGIPSVGLDLDPLSVLISQVKLAAAGLDPALLTVEAERATARVAAGNPSDQAAILFPAWLTKNRRMTSELADQFGREMHSLRAAVTGCDPAVRPLFRVLISDAIARRVRMRFLGTGVGRFSLTFSRATAPELFIRSLHRYARVTATFEWLRRTVNLQLAEAQVLQGDARRLPDGLGPFDMIVTSPPYLPASSGRESYAKARALSLIALEMLDPGDVDALVDDSIGSMEANGVNLAALTAAERHLVEWLQGDALRAIKAEPTARYFLDMAAAFREMFHTLRPGGMAVIVSGKQSTFYEFASRRALYVVPAADLLAERCRQAGFEVEAMHDLQLQKANRNARPRSLDDYYETLILLRKPA